MEVERKQLVSYGRSNSRYDIIVGATLFELFRSTVIPAFFVLTAPSSSHIDIPASCREI